jgi:hypothetical protein
MEEYSSFERRLCAVLMERKSWVPVKHYILKRNGVLLAGTGMLGLMEKTDM